MRRRILLATLFAVTVTGLALGVPLVISTVTVVESVFRGELLESAQHIATSIDDDLADGKHVKLSRFRYATPQGGQIVARIPPHKFVYGTDPGPDAVVEKASLVDGGSVRIAEPAGPIHKQQVRLVVFVVLALIASIGIGALVAIVTARRLARPLRDVAARAEKLGAGDFRPDPGRYGIQELDMVAETMDTSATALSRLLQRERDLVGDVSHQLRSRLTALALRIEGLSASQDEETAAEASAALEQADRLTAVLDELLAESRAARANEAKPVELDEQLAQIADEWRPVVEAAGGTLRLQLPPGLMAVATSWRLRETVGVLVDNAVQHGGDTITLSARSEESTVVVQVSDNGSGVPDELAQHVFERGVSGGGSSGVGLALARALVDADGGRLELATPRPATFSAYLLAPTGAGEQQTHDAPR